MGVMHIAQSTGAIKWGQAVIVRANDSFELQGVDKPPKHLFNPFDKDRGDIIGCFIVVKTDEGDYLTHSMPIDDIYAIRDRSESWIARMKKIAKKEPPSQTPWATDTEEMIKKTVVKQASKYWPRREQLDSVVHYMNTEGGEGINFAKEVSGKAVHSVTGESLAELDGDEQDKAREVAETVKGLLQEGHEWAAHDKVYSVDDEFRMAIWAVLGGQKYDLMGHKHPILYRSVLTKLHEAEENGERPDLGD